MQGRAKSGSAVAFASTAKRRHCGGPTPDVSTCRASRSPEYRLFSDISRPRSDVPEREWSPKVARYPGLLHPDSVPHALTAAELFSLKKGDCRYSKLEPQECEGCPRFERVAFVIRKDLAHPSCRYRGLQSKLHCRISVRVRYGHQLRAEPSIACPSRDVRCCPSRSDHYRRPPGSSPRWETDRAKP